MRCKVLRPLPGYEYQPGTIIDADFRNQQALINQRFLEPVGDGDRIAALEARLDALEEALGTSPQRARAKH